MREPTKLDQDDNAPDGSGNVPGTGLLNKALDILQYVGETDRRLKFKDLSVKTGFSKSTLYRILSALSSRDFIAMDRRDQSYILGSKFTTLAGSISRSSQLISVSSSIVKNIADTYGENVNIGVMNGDISQSTARWEGRGARPFASALGEKKPLYCTGLGKALLAFQPSGERDRLIAQIDFSRYTHNTIMSEDALREEILGIRARGFAIDDNEIIDGVRCVSVPVLDVDGNAIASISITGPSYRMIDDRLYELASVLQSAAREVSAQLRTADMSKTLIDSGNFAGQPITVHDVHSFETRSMIYDNDGRTLYWVDPVGACICRLSEKGRDVVSWFEGPVYGLCFNTGGDALLAISGAAIWRISPSGNEAAPAKLVDSIVFEDAKHLHQTPSGLIVIVKGENGAAGSLIAVDKDGAERLLVSEVSVSAGMAIGKDAHVIDALCATTGRRVSVDSREMSDAVRYSEYQLSSRPLDVAGLAIDSDGGFWLSHANNWRATCHDDRGDIVFAAPLPVPMPSAMAFNPMDHTMFVGSDRIGLSPNVIKLAPLSGGIFNLKKPAV